MKKLLLGTAAVAMGFAFAPAAQAQVSLDLGGHYKGYVVYHDQDTSGTNEERNVDWLQETEVHFSGETTLDNGLTVGVHVEAEADEGDSFEVDESYAYFAGSWGRVNAGNEDGAAYLLQVAAPSGDSNVDGIRQFVQPLNRAIDNLTAVPGVDNDGSVDYDNDLTTEQNKITYLSPVFSGFQFGASYTPEVTTSTLGVEGEGGLGALAGVNADDQEDDFGSAYEVALRYEGQFDEVGVAFGGGYTTVDIEEDTNNSSDDVDEWNVGLDLDWGPFGLGAVYTEQEGGTTLGGDAESETYVVGIDYTTGAFKLGASYLNSEEDETATQELETDRYTAGVIYTYGPGLTFRGSISHSEHDSEQDATEDDSTSVLLGTQIDF